MGKASSNKKVAKIARTGGGRTKRGGQSSSLFFPAVITITAVLGVFLIWFSRDQRQPDTSAPQPGQHWHTALGFDICGTFAPNIPDNGLDPLGIHTHSDGIIHVHPFTSLAAGRKATLKVYFDTLNLGVNETKIEIPGADKKQNGDMCGDKQGKVQVKVWDSRAPSDPGRMVSGSAAGIKMGDNMLVTIAFLPEGSEISRPPSEPELSRLTDVTGATTTTVAPSETTTTVPATTIPTTTIVPIP